MAAVEVRKVLFSAGLSSPQRTQRHGANDLRESNQRRKGVEATLNYHKDNEDGSPPHPTYVDRPETYDRPFESHSVTISDLTGDEEEFSLDINGFQIHHSWSTEKQFQDDDQIRSSYYAEVEELLKAVYLAQQHKDDQLADPCKEFILINLTRPLFPGFLTTSQMMPISCSKVEYKSSTFGGPSKQFNETHSPLRTPGLSPSQI
ncbi:hypothetical protein CSPX01_03999 [Colletotrichum filicis]|nr:hypothetical protein CSPX01_03999 [Colletotrichum filicis]